MACGPWAGPLPESDWEAQRLAAAYARRKQRLHSLQYSLLDPATLWIAQSCQRRILRLLIREGLHPLESKKVLEVGCGSGFWIREFVQWGFRPENLAGVDLLVDRVAEARQRCPQAVDLRCANAAALPFADETFDLVFQATVFTSILDPRIRSRVAGEMLRVVKPTGLILWYDFHVNNPRNPDVRGVTAAEIRELFAGCTIRLERTTLAPPLVRVLAARSWLACGLLAKIPLFCTHYLGAIRKAPGPCQPRPGSPSPCLPTRPA